MQSEKGVRLIYSPSIVTLESGNIVLPPVSLGFTMMFRTTVSIFLLFLIAPVAPAQPAAKPKWVDAQDLLVRTGGEKNFTKTTPKVGVEFYLDSTGGALIAITDSGTIAAVPTAAIGADRKATWAFAHDLRCRKAEQDGWKEAKPFGVEAFKYPAGKVVVYVS